ncbi:MAG: sugar phosphate isomerase/epimerase family protein [Thermoguttaceae bacterium]
MLRSVGCTFVVLGCLLGASSSAAAGQPAARPFFAFDNGVGRDIGMKPADQAALLADLGYAGIGYTGVKNLPEMLAALDAGGLRMFSTYLQVNLEPGGAAYDPELPKAVELLKPHRTALWIHLHGAKSPSEELDDRAVTVVREIADMAEKAGLQVVLYPHTGFYVANNADALRVVKKVARKNVGTSFNLCHFLKQQDEAEMERVIRESMPHLMLVSINGADSGDTRNMGWDRLIQTLDRGSFDMRRLLRLLDTVGYQGPIGLQCYAIPGDSRENLKRSKEAWDKLQ